MRKLNVWGVTAILGLGLAAHNAAAAGDEEPRKPSRTWLGRLFAGPPSPIDTIEEAAEATTRTPKTVQEPTLSGPEKEAERLTAFRKAQEDFLRREKVLDRLMQLAMESGDQETAKRVEALSDRAWNVYLKKTGKKPAVGGARALNENALPDRGEKP